MSIPPSPIGASNFGAGNFPLPDNQNSLALLALILSVQSPFKEIALQGLEQLLTSEVCSKQLSEHEWGLYLERAYQLKAEQERSAFFEKLIQGDSTRPITKLYYARCLFEAGQYERAEPIFKEIVALVTASGLQSLSTPKLIDAFAYSAEIALKKESVSEIEKELITGQTLHLLYFGQPNIKLLTVEARWLNKQQKYSATISICKIGLAMEPLNPQLLKSLIRAQAKSNKITEAIATCKELVTVNGNSSHILLGDLYFQEGTYQLAVFYHKSGITARQPPLLECCSLIEDYCKEKQFDLAKQLGDYVASAYSATDLTDLYLFMGELYATYEDSKIAFTYYTKALDEAKRRGVKSFSLFQRMTELSISLEKLTDATSFLKQAKECAQTVKQQLAVTQLEVAIEQQKIQEPLAQIKKQLQKIKSLWQKSVQLSSQSAEPESETHKSLKSQDASARLAITKLHEIEDLLDIAK